MRPTNARSAFVEQASRARRFGWVASALGVAALVMTRPVAATESDKPGDKAVCADSYRNAQVQRKSGALKRARESLLVCVSEKCPTVLHPDCTRWLTEVEAALPSITFAAKGADGKDLTSVRVWMDGQFVTDTIDGKSIPVDPGSHALRFEIANEPTIEQTIVTREGEKSRVVNANWSQIRKEEGAAEDPAHRVVRENPTGAWIFGGMGVGALATFGVLALHGMNRRSELEKECFGSCRQDQVDSIKMELLAGDIALGVGAVSLGVSLVLFLTRGRAPSSDAPTMTSPHAGAVSFGLAPNKDGGTAAVSARF